MYITFYLFTEGHLYWADALLHKIFRSNFDGNDKQFFHQDNGYLADLRLFGNYLYYTGLDNM